MNNYPTVFVHGFIGWGEEDGLTSKLGIDYFGLKHGLPVAADEIGRSALSAPSTASGTAAVSCTRSFTAAVSTTAKSTVKSTVMNVTAAPIPAS